MPKMITFTCLEVNPFRLKPSDVRLEDVAHALALTNRFGGHTKFPMSVAQHAVHVSLLCRKFGVATSWLALHHDDSEYLLGDMTKWVKQTVEMERYREVEAYVQSICEQRFGCTEDAEAREHVRWADDLMVRYEAMRGYDHFTFDDVVKYPPLTLPEIEMIGEWRPLEWQEAEAMFLLQAQALEFGVA